MSREKELEELIIKHKALYYQGRPEIQDHEYDQIEDELTKLNPKNIALNIVGSSILKGKKVVHDKKMLSLGKTYDVDDLIKWKGEEDILSTFKIDGVSCSIIYEHGKLALGKTRGDGTVGENITEKISWIPNIPKTINTNIEKIEVRGELYIDESSFFHLCDEMESINLDKPTSQRNIVAGLVSRKENIELCRYLSFSGFVLIEDDSLETEYERMNQLKKYGFETVDYIVHRDQESIKAVIESAKDFMSSGEYSIDGIVFTLNKLSLHEELGETAHHPRYKMAFKFAGESKITELKSITWQVSRNGILTPVGEIQPIELSGALVSRVTLHNYGVVNHYKLKSGDRIEIIRSGEVIPKLLSKVEESDSQFITPEVCPSCEKPIRIDDIRIFCDNSICPAKNKELILNFIQKIGIDDLSGKRLEDMMNAKLVNQISDLYKLKESDLLSLDKVKEKLSTKILSSIEKSKDTNLVKFIGSLGLTGGAFNKTEKVVNAGFDTIEKMLSMKVEDLINVDSFAEKSATDFISSLKEKESLIKELISCGFKFESIVKKPLIESFLTGKKVCITGTLSEKRSVLEGLVKDNGGSIVTSVTKNTDFLLTNDTESSSSKFKKAKQLEVPLLSEDDLKSRLGI